ncbi:MAG TPA: adenylate/guanylate cyclase domain-containing protein [Polyangia bacterium]|jgi:class 3 adenylate cyclase|nr:adenylate/guanylate cyclase domain-containing protein [Polyangia bacterium]
MAEKLRGHAGSQSGNHGGSKTRAALEKLLEKRNEHPERLTELDREIWDTFGQTHAVWVLDMCGFSRLTMRYGITHFLAMIHRLHGIVRPIIAQAKGRVVKTEADNVFAVFDRVESAVAAAREVQDQLATANVFLPEDWDLHASIGIGYGEVLMIEDHDFYGHELNLASKLGEDIAEAGETLITEAAHVQLLDEGPRLTLSFDAREVVVSKMTLRAFALT